MTQAQLDEWLARLSYKPGWMIVADAMLMPGYICVTVGYTGPDSNEPGNMRAFSYSQIFPLHSFEQFANNVMQTIHALENHEQLEFFKVDGKHWNQPHNPRAIFVVL